MFKELVCVHVTFQATNWLLCYSEGRTLKVKVNFHRLLKAPCCKNVCGAELLFLTFITLFLDGGG